MSLVRLSALVFLLLASLVCSTSAAASCHIPKQWSTSVAGRSDRLLVSELWLNDTSYPTSFHYALRVKDGSVAWQWPTAPLGDMTQAVQLLPSASPERVYALASYERDAMQANGSVCAVMVALHSSNGQVEWQYDLCLPQVAGVGPAFTILPSPQPHSTAGERILLSIGSTAVSWDGLHAAARTERHYRRATVEGQPDQRGGLDDTARR